MCSDGALVDDASTLSKIALQAMLPPALATAAGVGRQRRTAPGIQRREGGGRGDPDMWTSDSL